MVTIRQYYLMKLAEECTEVGKRALKQIQFGAEQIQKGNEVKDGVAAPDKEAGLTNRQRLSNEINDLMTIVDILQELEQVETESEQQFFEYMDLKKARLYKYLAYSQELGLVGKS